MAGKRKGKADERHLWPQMLRVIREIAPRYIVGENVLGLVNWDGGLVFDEVQADLEAQGYEVATVVIPAAAVNAPHGRDRVWFVAQNAMHSRCVQREFSEKEQRELGRNGGEVGDGIAADTGNKRPIQCGISREVSKTERISGKQGSEFGISSKAVCNGFKPDWQNFPTQSPVCGGDDGLPTELDGITFSKWRNESIRAYGNAIVPNVAFEIFKVIQTIANT